MESLESDTDKERASLLSILSKVHYIIQKYIKKKHTYFFINCVLLLARTVQVENFEVFLISRFSWVAAEHEN